MSKAVVAIAGAAACAIGWTAAATRSVEESRSRAPEELSRSSETAARSQPPPADERVEVPPPPFTEGIFPCTGCHNQDLPVNRTRRALTDMHDDIQLRHDQEHRWCLDCHDAGQRDQLHLASGEPVPFAESYRLCGQCHGEKYRDWRAGVHGRRVGQWNGAKRYLLCVHCHNPHQPRFRAIQPMPAPPRPVR